MRNHTNKHRFDFGILQSKELRDMIGNKWTSFSYYNSGCDCIEFLDVKYNFKTARCEKRYSKLVKINSIDYCVDRAIKCIMDTNKFIGNHPDAWKP
jgi:hypothetical protein